MALWGPAKPVGELKTEEAAAMGEQKHEGEKDGQAGGSQGDTGQSGVEPRAAALEGVPTLLRAIWKMDSGERPCSWGRRS